jgi:hypothetical protein
MNLQFQQWLPQDFAPESRVWIYQSNRQFTISEALEIEEALEQFTENWKSHGAIVKGYANLLYGRFILLMADETNAGVSGCSTDNSIHFIKKIETQYGFSLFDRLQLAFVVKDTIELLPLSQVNYALQNNFITPDTLYFNNTVQTKAELQRQWLIPVSESWLKNKLVPA